MPPFFDRARLAILAVLRLQPGSLGVLAPVCSSMGFLTSSQSNRSFVLPLGSSQFSWVDDGNILAVRLLSMHVHMVFFRVSLVLNMYKV